MHPHSCTHGCMYMHSQHTHERVHTYMHHTHTYTRARETFSHCCLLCWICTCNPATGEWTGNGPYENSTSHTAPQGVCPSLRPYELLSISAAALHTTCSFSLLSSEQCKCMFVFINAAKMWHTLLNSPLSNILEILWHLRGNFRFAWGDQEIKGVSVLHVHTNISFSTLSVDITWHDDRMPFFSIHKSLFVWGKRKEGVFLC